MAALRTVSLALGSVAVLLVASMAAEVAGHNVEPERRDVTEERIRQLQLPAGLTVNVVARNLGNPRKDGALLVPDDAKGVIHRGAYSTPPR